MTTNNIKEKQQKKKNEFPLTRFDLVYGPDVCSLCKKPTLLHVIFWLMFDKQQQEQEQQYVKLCIDCVGLMNAVLKSASKSKEYREMMQANNE